MTKQKFDVTKHVLVPKHSKVSDKEKKELFEKYGISLIQLPKILKNDPFVDALGAKPGDVIKITRKSPTSGEAVFYRSVTSE
jgi:DNA-directed RNA polymerase subunit H